MGFLDKLLGREPLQQQRPQQPAPPTGQPHAVPPPRGGASTEDERAIARYKYLLRTADPEDIEKVHAEAFAKLSPEQRQMVLQRLTDDLPESERPRSDQPADLARSATRAEVSRPGYLQGAFGGGRGGTARSHPRTGGFVAGDTPTAYARSRKVWGQRWFSASVSTERSRDSMSSNCSGPMISGGASWMTGSPRSSARQ